MSSTATKILRESASPEDPPRAEFDKNEEIARLAYSYWEGAGRPSGSAEEDWLRAERDLQLGSDSAPPGTTPAS